MTDEKLTLSELQLIIKDSLYLSLPDFYWVTAEISEIKENYSGHCYLELVEKKPEDNNIRARIRAVIWNSRYRIIRSFFENSTGESLREGIKILIRVKIEYHEIYGLSLVIFDIDPAYTLGDLAVKRQMIIRKLEEDGVLNMNKELDFPLFPQKIAIISSRNAAGYSDFIRHLKENSYGYVFYTALFDTVMQGSETEASVLSSLNKIASKIHLFDVAVIIRGGGSQTDLSWFDNYNIAYYITQFPVPVLTGIGHEKDMSVADIVSYKSLKTPTAVADFLIEQTINAETCLKQMSEEIAEKVEAVINENKARVDSVRMKMIPAATIMLSEARQNLSDLMIEITNTGKKFIMKAGMLSENQKIRLASVSKALTEWNYSLLKQKKNNLLINTRNRIEKENMKMLSLENSLKMLSPDNVLRRGYTITSLNGRILKSSGNVKTGDILGTQFADGKIHSKVL